MSQTNIKVKIMIERLNYVCVNIAAINAMAAAKKCMPSIDGKLRALIELRVSQIDGCAQTDS